MTTTEYTKKAPLTSNREDGEESSSSSAASSSFTSLQNTSLHGATERSAASSRVRASAAIPMTASLSRDLPFLSCDAVLTGGRNNIAASYMADTYERSSSSSSSSSSPSSSSSSSSSSSFRPSSSSSSLKMGDRKTMCSPFTFGFVDTGTLEKSHSLSKAGRQEDSLLNSLSPPLSSKRVVLPTFLRSSPCISSSSSAAAAASTAATTPAAAIRGALPVSTDDATDFHMKLGEKKEKLQSLPSSLFLPPTVEIVYSSPSADIALLTKSFGLSIPSSYQELCHIDTTAAPTPAVVASPFLTFFSSSLSTSSPLTTPPYCQINDGLPESYTFSVVSSGNLLSVLHRNLRLFFLQLFSLFGCLYTPSFYPSSSLPSFTYIEVLILHLCDWVSTVFRLFLPCCLHLLLFLPRLLLRCLYTTPDEPPPLQQQGAFAVGTCSLSLFTHFSNKETSSSFSPPFSSYVNCIPPLQQRQQEENAVVHLILDSAYSEKAREVDGGGVVSVTLLAPNRGASSSITGTAKEQLISNSFSRRNYLNLLNNSNLILYGHSPAAVLLRNRGKTSSFHAALGLAKYTSQCPKNISFSAAPAPVLFPSPTDSTVPNKFHSPGAAATARGKYSVPGAARTNFASAGNLVSLSSWSEVLKQWMCSFRKNREFQRSRYATAAVFLSPAVSSPLLLVGYSDGRLETFFAASASQLLVPGTLSSSFSSSNVMDMLQKNRDGNFSGLSNGEFADVDNHPDAFSSSSFDSYDKQVDQAPGTEDTVGRGYRQKSFADISSFQENPSFPSWHLINVNQLQGPVLCLRNSPCNKRICVLTSQCIYILEISEEQQHVLETRNTWNTGNRRSEKVDLLCAQEDYTSTCNNFYRCIRFSSILAFGKEALYCRSRPLACCWTNACQLLILDSDGRIAVFFRDPRKNTSFEWRCLTRLLLEPATRRHLTQQLSRSSSSSSTRQRSSNTSNRRNFSRGGSNRVVENIDEGDRNRYTERFRPTTSFRQEEDSSSSAAGNAVRFKYKNATGKQQQRAERITQENCTPEEDRESFLYPSSSSFSGVTAGSSSAYGESMLQQEKILAEEEREKEREIEKELERLKIQKKEQEEEMWQTSFPVVTMEFSASQQVLYISLRGYPRLLIIPWKVFYASVLPTSSSSSFFYVPLKIPASNAAAVISSLAAQIIRRQGRRRRGGAGGLLAALKSKFLYQSEKLFAPLHALDFSWVVGRVRKRQLTRQKLLERQLQEQAVKDKDAMRRTTTFRHQMKEAVGEKQWLGIDHVRRRRILVETQEMHDKYLQEERNKRHDRDISTSHNSAVGGIVSFALTTTGAAYLAVLHAQCDNVFVYDAGFFDTNTKRDDGLLPSLDAVRGDENILLGRKEEEEQQQQLLHAPVLRFCLPPPCPGCRPAALAFLAAPPNKMIPGLSFFSPSPSATVSSSSSVASVLLVVRWVYPCAPSNEKEDMKEHTMLLMPAFTIYYSLPSNATAAPRVGFNSSRPLSTLFPPQSHDFISKYSVSSNLEANTPLSVSSMFPLPMTAAAVARSASSRADAAASTRIAAAEQEILNAWRTAAGLDSSATDVTAVINAKKTSDANDTLKENNNDGLGIPTGIERDVYRGLNDGAKTSRGNVSSSSQTVSGHPSNSLPNLCTSNISHVSCDPTHLGAHREKYLSTYSCGGEAGNQHWKSKEETAAQFSKLCQAATARPVDISGMGGTGEASLQNNIRYNTRVTAGNNSSPFRLENSRYYIDRNNPQSVQEKGNVVSADGNNSNAGFTSLADKSNIFGEHNILAPNDISHLNGENSWLQRWQLQQQKLVRRWQLQQPQQQETDQQRWQNLCHSDIEIPPLLPSSFSRWTPSYQRIPVQRSAPYSFLHPYNATNLPRLNGLQANEDYSAMLHQQQQRFIQQQQFEQQQQQQQPFSNRIPALASDHLHNVLRQPPHSTLSHDMYNPRVSNCLIQGTTSRRANAVSPVQTYPGYVDNGARFNGTHTRLYDDPLLSGAGRVAPNQSLYSPLLQQGSSAVHPRNPAFEQQELSQSVLQPEIQVSNRFFNFTNHDVPQGGSKLVDLDFSSAMETGGLASRGYTEACNNPQTNPLSASALRLSNSSFLQPFSSTAWATNYSSGLRTSIL